MASNATNFNFDTEFLNYRLNSLLPYYLTASCTLLLVSVISVIKLRIKKHVNVPFYGSEAPKVRWINDPITLLRDGYAKFRDQPFQIWTTEGNHVVIPPKFIDELRMMQNDKVTTSMHDFLQQQHTTFPGSAKNGFLTNVVKQQLNKNLPKMFPYMKEECDHAISIELPLAQDWTSISAYGVVTRIVCRVTGRAFAGPDINRNERWIEINLQHTRDLFQGAAVLRTWPYYLRYVTKYFTPEIRRIWKNNAESERLLAPIIKQRVRDEKIEGYEKPIDYLQWAIDGLKGSEKEDYTFLAIQQLGLGAASIHTTSMLLTNAVFDLAARPEYRDKLRGEANKVLNELGRKWNLESMNELKKMDSFLKESQRLNGTIIAFQRKAMKDLTLSDGTFIPAGTLFLAPAVAIATDESVYPGAESFDGLRYYKKRAASKQDENMHQLTSTSKTMLGFSTGRHACPGRWFASAESKMILAGLLLHYDFKLKEGEERPASLLSQGMRMPNPMAKIIFKKLSV